jgi:hypothetical protein
MLSGSLAMAGCVTDQNYRVRAIADPAAKFRYGGTLVAQGRAQLALGNVGLALETFRKAQREQPPSADSFAGIAACYGAMGRYDLARANYEYALAYAPNDVGLLTALASSLERLGEGEQAASVRAEASRLAAAPALTVRAEVPARMPEGVPRVSSVTVELPKPTPVADAPVHATAGPMPKTTAEGRVIPAVAASQLPPPTVKISATSLPPPTIQLGAVASVQMSSNALVPMKTGLELNEVIVPIRIEAPEAIAPRPTEPAVERSVAATTTTAPLAATAKMLLAASTQKAPAVQRTDDRPPAMPTVGPREEILARGDPQEESGPRLQRLSQSEVSLVTGTVPVRPRGPQMPRPTHTEVAMIQAPQRLASADSVRWLPLKYAPPRVPIQLLNAARTQSLAARTRAALLNHGWSKIRIGNARKIRQHSLVLYASARWAVARRLAAHLGCKAVRSDKVQNVVVLLGRDGALPRRGSART